MTIVQMDQFFLYLPLYYAARNRFFGFVPSRYTIEISPPPINNDSDTEDTLHTDTAAFNALMDHSTVNQHVVFAVCDPMVALDCVLRRDPEQQPAVLAALVTNAAFWAVDRNSYSVRTFNDLTQYSRILCFKEGSTSYGIAKRIERKMDPSRRIKIDEIEHHEDLLRTLVKSQKGAIALSPDPLEIEFLRKNNQGFHIDLALGTTAEYANVLTTVLMSRADVVRNHRDLVVGVVKGLDHAMQAVRLGDSEVKAYAADKFNRRYEHVEGALETARRGQVFPASLEITEAQWERSAEAAHDAHGRAWDNTAQIDARSRFDAFVAPYSDVVDEALVQPSPPPPLKKGLSGLRVAGIALLLFVLGCAVGSFLPGTRGFRVIGTIAATGTAGWAFASFMRASLISRWGYVYLGGVAALAIFCGLWTAIGSHWSVEFVIPTLLGIMALCVPAIAEAIRHDKDSDD